MGQITSLLARPFRNFNIENRATKVLERRQRVAEGSPNHPSTVGKLSRFRSEHPEFLEAQKMRDEKLHERLKVVYVESKSEIIQPKPVTKPLPLSREPPPETDMGVLESASDVPVGRASLKTVFTFLGQHHSDRQNYTAAKIAKEYRLDETEVENVLQYFKIMRLHLPQEMYKKIKGMDRIVGKQMETLSSQCKTFLLSERTEKKENPQDDILRTKT